LVGENAAPPPPTSTFLSEEYTIVTHTHAHVHTHMHIAYMSNICLLFQRKEYVKYAKVFPLSEALDFKVPSKWYRRTIGTLEIICGLAMAFVPSSMYHLLNAMLFKDLLLQM
jgi:hypothetical protein